MLFICLLKLNSCVSIAGTYALLTPHPPLSLQEYVELYTDWLLNRSIATNFDAFRQGFELVMDQSFLADLFTAEEVELLVCGSNVRWGEGVRV